MAQSADQPDARRKVLESTAIYAWIASVLAGATWKEFEAWTEEHLGERLDRDAVRRHVRSCRPPSTRGRRKRNELPRAAPTEAEKREAVIRDWLRIHEEKLGLRKVLFRIPGRFDERQALHDALDQIAGIRQFVELKRDYEVLAIVVVRNEAEEDLVRAQVQEHVPWGNVETEPMLLERQDSAALMWLGLARAQLSDDRRSQG